MPFELIIIQFNGMCVCGLYKWLWERGYYLLLMMK